MAFCGVAVLSGPVSSGATSHGDEKIAGEPFCPAEAEACMALAVTDPPEACNDGKCAIAAGAKFTLVVDIVKKPVEGYILAQSMIDFGDDLEYKPATLPSDEFVWPDCPDDLGLRSQGGTTVTHGCFTEISATPAKSHHQGTFVSLSVNCSPESSSTLVDLIAATDTENVVGSIITKPNFAQLIPDVAGLTVNCGVPDTSTPGGPNTATPTPTGTLTQATATPTPSETPTGTLAPATATPAATPLLTPAGSVTPTASWTPAATVTSATIGAPATPTNTPTSTRIPTNTPTARPVLLGDVNCDGSVDPIDAAFLLQLEAALIGELPCPDAGDVDGDGETTLIDATVILQYSSGLISSLPA